jgi:hypothetical protein
MQTHLRWGLTACALYVLGCTVIGEAFPFSRFSMYAGLGGRDHAAVPSFELDGELVDPMDLAAFSGIDPQALVPPGVATSQEHTLAPVARHIAAHPGSGEGGQGLQVVWRVFRIDDGELTEERLVGQEGQAWRSAP